MSTNQAPRLFVKFREESVYLAAQNFLGTLAADTPVEVPFGVFRMIIGDPGSPLLFARDWPHTIAFDARFELQLTLFSTLGGIFYAMWKTAPGVLIAEDDEGAILFCANKNRFIVSSVYVRDFISVTRFRGFKQWYDIPWNESTINEYFDKVISFAELKHGPELQKILDE